MWKRALFVAVVLAGCGTAASPEREVARDAPDGGTIIVPPSAGDAGIDAPVTTTPVRVLFVGNSYTFVNDLPSTVRALGGGAVTVDSVTEGGATLGSLWAAGTAPARIASRAFDVVVVQGNSLEAFGNADFFYDDAKLFADAIRDAGARTVWYATWARRADDGIYTEGLITPAIMTQSIDHAYRTAAASSGGTVARAGVAWQRAIAEQPAVVLYADDGSHPSPAGTLLTACTMVLAITGREAVLPDPVPFGIDRATATALCAHAPEVQCGPAGCGCESSAHVTTTFTALHATTPACDGSTERRGPDCSAAMNAACATACTSGGFGTAATPGDVVDLTCVAGTALPTTLTALRAIDPSCDAASCATAIDQACATAGALSGFGPVAVNGDDVTAMCVPSSSARRAHVAYSRLGAFDGNCNGVTQSRGPDCDIAIDHLCRSQGYGGGFGPTAITATGADLVCVTW